MRSELRESNNELRTEINNCKNEILAKLKQVHENILHRWIAQSSVLIMTATAVIISTITFMHR